MKKFRIGIYRVEEETGVTAIHEIVFFSGLVSTMEIPVSSTQKVGLVLMIYKIKIPKDSTIIPSEEHTRFEWIKPKAAVERLRYKYSESFVEAILALGEQ